MSQRVLWSGRFKEIASDQTLAFTSSLAVDRRLAWYDVMGSIAHAQMLSRQGVLPPLEVSKIVEGLKGLLDDIENDALHFSEKLEDVHTNVEFQLTERVGEAGARLHTARSRNDQVATDFRMFLRDQVLEMCAAIADLQSALIKMAKGHLDTIMPGFTHMQHAQPVSLAHHLLAHVQRLQRDTERFLQAYGRINLCPLGASALAGTTYPIDRRFTAEALGFKEPTENSLDSVSDRDFASEFVFCTSLLMTHLSSISEEIVIWSTPEFSFVEVSDAFSTGSSIMPQKKNPDVAELIRGRTGITFGNLMSLLTMNKALPLAYNRDLQEDKGLVLSASDTALQSARIMASMLTTLTFNRTRMREAAEKGYLNATELADYLVTKGVPFRRAHEITGKVVRHAIDKDKRLEELGLEELRHYSDSIMADVFDVLPVEKCVERRTSYGGTARKAVETQLSKAQKAMRLSIEHAKAERGRLDLAFRSLLSD